MFEQNTVGQKLLSFKNKVASLLGKVTGKKNVTKESQSQARLSTIPEMHQFDPTGDVATAPRTKTPLQSGASAAAQNLVWENEDASMQDKSYSFDEQTTDADYDAEDDLNFADENESEPGEESRFR
jgi:hypothetical protein